MAPGSIYHALKKLANEGLLRELGTERVGARPARTMYEITERGEREFQDMLRDFWWEHRQPFDPFMAAFALLPALPEREAAAALRNRSRFLRGQIDELQAMIDQGPGQEQQPPHVFEMFRLGIARCEADIAWCERVAELVERGELTVDEQVWKEAGWSRQPTAVPGSSNIQT